MNSLRHQANTAYIIHGDYTAAVIHCSKAMFGILNSFADCLLHTNLSVLKSNARTPISC